jgi:hypothetical protein
VGEDISLRVSGAIFTTQYVLFADVDAALADMAGTAIPAAAARSVLTIITRRFM